MLFVQVAWLFVYLGGASLAVPVMWPAHAWAPAVSAPTPERPPRRPLTQDQQQKRA